MKIKAIVEADRSKFFSHLDLSKLVEMLKKRLDDRLFLRLIQKRLKAGICSVIVEFPKHGVQQLPTSRLLR